MASVVKRVRFVSVGYSNLEMEQVGTAVVRNGIVPRIRAALTVTDSAAKPLTRSYGRLKALKHPPAVRNWEWTCRTLRSMKVIQASTNRAVIAFADTETNRRAFINNARERQFGVSPSDYSVIRAEFQKLPPFVKAVESNGSSPSSGSSGRNVNVNYKTGSITY